MRLETRKLLDKAFSGFGIVAIAIMALALIFILAPILIRGSKAFVFKGTIEHRRVMLEQFHRGDAEKFTAEMAEIEKAREPLYEYLAAYETENLAQASRLEKEIEQLETQRDQLKDEKKEVKRINRKDPRIDEIDEERDQLKDKRDRKKEELKAFEQSKMASYIKLTDALRTLIGPLKGEEKPITLELQYGQTRWNRTQEELENLLAPIQWVSPDGNPKSQLVEKRIPRVNEFKGTALEPFFPYLENHIEEIMHPKTTFYWRFLTDSSKGNHFFGGIWPAVLGTIYLTLGAMIFAIPMGVIAAIYLCEYAHEGRIISFLRVCISTLAGVPSIVFGLFGLTFFINTMHVSQTKSVIAGSLTLSLLVLPTIIRASEEAILAVPRAYKEAAFGLGAGRWRTVLTVILPAALPGILTGIVISMGRAAGETAPIIFTAAVSVKPAIALSQVLTDSTQALPWGIYNLATEHAKADQIEHVQYGMVLTLISIVLLLNLLAIVLRARISKKLRG